VSLRVIEITLKISLPDEPVDFKRFDEILSDELRRGVEKVVQSWVDEVEKREFEGRKRGSLRKEVREACYWRLGFADVRVERYKVSECKPGGGRTHYHLVDRLMRMNGKVAPGLRRKAVELACDVSYAKASRRLSAGRLGSISRMGIHHWVQKEGKKVRGDHQARVREALSLGAEVTPLEQRPVVVVETDTTCIPWRKEKGAHFDVKLGVVYTRKRDCGKNGRRRRMELSDKVVVGSVESSREFGEVVWYEAQRNFGVMDAEHVFYQSDGDRGLKEIQAMHFPNAHAQVDLWHIMERLCGVARGDRKKVSRLARVLYRGDIDGLLMELRLWWAAASTQDQADKLKELLDYVEENRDLILVFRRFLGEVDEETKSLLVTGTGAIEKNIDIVVSHRFKKRGMKWSKEGARNLLALRALRMRPRDWEEHWRACA